MSDKQTFVRPTPALCRERLKRKTINKRTGNPMSDSTVQRVFKALCFDETEDDPWQWLGSASQEYLPAHMKPIRAAFGDFFVQRFAASAWFSFVAIDPCRSLLPKTPTKAEEQKHAAMGKMGWRSRRSLRMSCNCKKVSTANSQTNGRLSVSWTPVFARGKVKIYLCSLDDAGPEKLSGGPLGNVCRMSYQACFGVCKRSSAGPHFRGSWCITKPLTSSALSTGASNGTSR